MAAKALASGRATGIRNTALAYDVFKTTLGRRQKSVSGDRTFAHANQQRLSRTAEDALEWMIIRLIEADHPPKYKTVHQLAWQNLVANSSRREANIPPLGKNWAERYVRKRSVLYTKWLTALDQQRSWQNRPDIVHNWFDLYRSVRIQYNVADEDVWNMDEKGCALGIVSGAKVVIHRSMRKTYFFSAWKPRVGIQY